MNAANSDGCTALAIAVAEDNLPLTQALLRLGASTLVDSVQQIIRRAPCMSPRGRQLSMVQWVVYRWSLHEAAGPLHKKK